MSYGAGMRKRKLFAADGYGTERRTDETLRRGRVFENLRSRGAAEDQAENHREQDGGGGF